MIEEWKPVVGFEDKYEVSSHGRVRSIPHITVVEKQLAWGIGLCTFRYSGQVLRPSVVKGYLVVKIGRQSFKVHTLVLNAFRGPRGPKEQCRHGDGDRKNNFLKNICWGTAQQNSDDKTRHGTSVCGERHHSAKLTDADVMAIRSSGASPVDVAMKYGIGHRTATKIIQRISWKHIP